MFLSLNSYIKKPDDQDMLYSFFSKDPQDCGESEVEILKTLLLKVPTENLNEVLTNTVIDLLIYCNFHQENFYENAFGLFSSMLEKDFGYSNFSNIIESLDVLAREVKEETVVEHYEDLKNLLSKGTDELFILACQRIFLNKIFLMPNFFKIRNIVKELSSALIEHKDSLEIITTISANMALLTNYKAEE